MLPGHTAAGSLTWMSLGACYGEDPELFFPVAAAGPALRQINAAKAVCRRCTVRAPCLSYAMDAMPEGIWGGTTPEERLAMREQFRRRPLLDRVGMTSTRASGARQSIRRAR
jgi:WhiB family transcriptional regulator, redox-sensing transcriptional regulator